MNAPRRATPQDPPPGGFADPVFDSQRTFRTLLEAMAHPGSILPAPRLPDVPAPLYPSAAALCLALADFDTPLWLDAPLSATPTVKALFGFHCGCPLTEDPGQAAFALIAAAPAMPPLEAFAQGSDEYPDRSTTLVIQVAELSDDPAVTLRGPGIRSQRTLDARPLPGDFWRQVQANGARFPRGVDIVLASGRTLAALPRSTRIEA